MNYIINKLDFWLFFSLCLFLFLTILQMLVSATPFTLSFISTFSSPSQFILPFHYTDFIFFFFGTFQGSHYFKSFEYSSKGLL